MKRTICILLLSLLGLLPVSVVYSQTSSTPTSLQHDGVTQLSTTMTGPITWTVANTDVARVSPTGLVRGILVGKTIVTATSGEAQQTFDIVVAPRYTNAPAEPYTAAEVRTLSAVMKYETSEAGRQELSREDLSWLPGHEMLTFGLEAHAPITVQYLVNKETQQILPYATMVFASRKLYDQTGMAHAIAERYHAATGEDSEGETFDGWARGKVGLEYRALSIEEGDEPVINLAYCIVSKMQIKQEQADIAFTLSAPRDISLYLASKSGIVQVDWGNGSWQDYAVSPTTATAIKGASQGTTIGIKGQDISHLLCSNNDIVALDLLEVPELLTLRCYSNHLTALALSKAPKLQELNCSDNKLVALDLLALPVLSDLNAANNAIEGINLTANKKLVSLSLLGNKLSAIDLSACPLLEDVSVGYNRLKAFDLSACPNVFWIICYKNELSSEALIKLYQTLPQRSQKDGTLKLLESRDDEVPEGNAVDINSIHLATTKGWKVMDGTNEITPTSRTQVLASDTPAVQVSVQGNCIQIRAGEEFFLYGADARLSYHGIAGVHTIARGRLGNFFLIHTASGQVQKYSL